MEFVKITTYSPYGDERYYYEEFPDGTPDIEIEALANDYLEEDMYYFWNMSFAATDYEDDFYEFQKDCNYWIEFKDEHSFIEEVYG